MTLSRRAYPVACVAIVALACGLRFLHLGDWSMWIDEGMTYVRATTGVLDDQGPLYATAPVNFWITRQLVLGMGPTLFWLRVFPALCGCLGVAAVLLAGRRIGGRTCSVVAGLLVALRVWHLDWSQNARHYALLFLCATLTITAFWEFWETSRVRWLVAAALAAALGLATHSSMAFVLAALGAYSALLLAHPRTRREVVSVRKLIQVGAWFALIGLGYLPIVYVVSQYLGESKTAWNPPFNVAGGIVFYLGVIEGVLAGVIGIRGAAQGSRPHLLGVCWLAVPALLATAAADFTISSNVYALSSLGGAALLIGLGIADGLRQDGPDVRALAVGLAAALALGALSRDYLYFTAEGGNRPPWREAADWLAPRLDEADAVYSSEGVVLGYHLGDPARGGWLDAWIAHEGPWSSPRQWVLVLGGRDALEDPRAVTRLETGCRLQKVFYRNSGPKRRDVEVYECRGT